MKPDKYPKGKQDYKLIVVFLSLAIISLYYIENYLNLLFIIISLIAFYGAIIKRQKGFDHNKYNFKSRHPAFKLIEQYGFDKVYKNLINTVENTKGFTHKGDSLYATDYQIFNYYVTLSVFIFCIILSRNFLINNSAKNRRKNF